VLLVAGALLRRVQKPSRTSDIALGLAIGTSLLYRSTLCFLPPLIAIFDRILRRPEAGARSRLGYSLALPYVFLVPWILMNHRISGRLVVFEDGRAIANILTGALGIAPTSTGDWARAFAPELSKSATTGAALRWAIGKIAAHPLGYASGYLNRLVLSCLFHPILTLLALAAFWRRRCRPEVRAIALLASYLVAIQCFMSINAEYLMPVWPLLALIAAVGLEFPRRWTARFKSGAFASAAAIILAAHLAVALALCLAASAFVLRYPGRAARGDALASELSSWPNDDWLLATRGKQSLEAGDYAAAASDLTTAQALSPSDDRLRLEAAWADALAGRPRMLMDFSPSSTAEGNGDLPMRLSLYRAHWLFKSGKTAQAKKELETFVIRARSQPGVLWLDATTPRDRWVAEKLRAVAADNAISHISLMLSSTPADESAALTRLAESSQPRGAGAAGSTKDAGPAMPPESAWDRAAAMLWFQPAMPAESARDRAAAMLRFPFIQLAFFEQDHGRPQAALATLRFLEFGNPSPELLHDEAVAEYLAGRTREAERDARRALLLNPGFLSAYMTLGTILCATGRGGEGRIVYERGLKVVVAGVQDAKTREALQRALLETKS
jgi:Flp pilus assembly protein TadD